MSRIVHFELPVDDAERLLKFYRSVFGWRIEKWAGEQDYWLVTTGDQGEPGIDGALTRRSETFMSTVNTVGVESVDDYVAKIKAAGGKILMEKGPIPSMGWVAYAQDPEGNNFGLFQADTTAR